MWEIRIFRVERPLRRIFDSSGLSWCGDRILYSNLFIFFSSLFVNSGFLKGKFPSCHLFTSHRKMILVGGLHFLCSIIYGIILPIDFHIFQRGWNHQPVISCCHLPAYKGPARYDYTFSPEDLAISDGRFPFCHGATPSYPFFSLGFSLNSTMHFLGIPHDYREKNPNNFRNRWSFQL